MKTKSIIIYIFLIFLVASCTSFKNAVTGKKENNSDEFLIEKKKPLEVPPDYELLPKPKDSTEQKSSEQILDNEIDSLLDEIKKEESNDGLSNSKDRSAEDLILENIE